VTTPPGSKPDRRNRELRFSFGRNWRSYLDRALDQDRIASAKGSLQQLLGLTSLGGRTFLDVGCGSGLFSLAALLLGADKVVAFDFDPESVQASRELRSRAGFSPERWAISQGSILDRDFLAGLELAEVVYSWGVLHHTGRMWEAIDRAAELVKPGGILAMAIYNKVESWSGGSAKWWHIKRFHNLAPAPVRRLMEALYASYLLVGNTVLLRNPVRMVRSYGLSPESRGMSFWHDLRDWLGGFPFEYASAGEVFNYVHRRHGLGLIFLRDNGGHGCNEFAFRKPL